MLKSSILCILLRKLFCLYHFNIFKTYTKTQHLHTTKHIPIIVASQIKTTRTVNFVTFRYVILILKLQKKDIKGKTYWKYGEWNGK